MKFLVQLFFTKNSRIIDLINVTTAIIVIKLRKLENVEMVCGALLMLGRNLRIFFPLLIVKVVMLT